MSMYELRVPVSLLFGALIGFLSLSSAVAAAPSVTAVLSNSEVGVGETVQLEIRVTDAGEATTPREISVDGLEIHPTGTSRQIEMHNFSVKSTVTYNYTVLPLKAGTFKIPPQEIHASGTSLRTPELALHVVASPGRQAVPNRGTAPNVDTGKLAFAELVVPKRSAYVGELIPAVVRLGFRTPRRITEGPEITGQGFTLQKLQGEDQPQVELIDGKQWDVYTFKTAIAAARTGKFEIGPVKVTAKLVVPTQSRSPRSRSPFDIFDMEDPLSDPFFNNPFGRSGEKREVPIVSAPVTLEVKPLPPNAPANFAGAVGNFTMTVDGNPKSVQVGDPITVTATVSGRGNFDRVNAPALEDERGWHKYPPSAKFKQDDDIGISGAKTFETVLSPSEKKQAIPPLIFAYFDPLKENYITLRGDPIPIKVEGGAVSAGAATPATTAATSTPPTARRTSKAQDILYQLTERPGRAQSFTSFYTRPNFWLAQVVPFLGLFGFIGWKLRQARLDNREAQRIAALHQEAAELMRKLQRNDTSPKEYFLQASRAIQVKTALAKNVDPNAVDMEMAAAAFRLDETSRQQLRRLFERSDELRYSGAHNGVEAISPESRREMLDLIENLRS